MGVILNYPKLHICYVSNKNDVIKTVDGLSRNILTMGDISGTQLAENYKKHCYNPSTDLQLNTLSTRSHNPLHTVATKVEVHDLIKAQESSPELGPMMTTLEKTAEKIIEKNRKKYFLGENGVLRMFAEDGTSLVVVPELLAFEICEWIHQMSLHTGIRKMRQIIYDSKLIIPNKSRILTKIARECIFCQFSNSKTDHGKEQFSQRPALEPWAQVSVDLVDIGGYGFRYKFLLTFFCKCTKFVDTRLLLNKTGKEVAKHLSVLLHKWNCGQHSHLVMDNGLEFNNAEITALFAALGISKSNVSSYNSRASACERSHRSIRHCLRSLPTNAYDFPSRIDLAVSSYNHTVQSGMQYRSPSQLLYGTVPRNYMHHLMDRDNQKDMLSLTETEQNEKRSVWANFLSEHHQLAAQDQLVRYESLVNKQIDVFQPGELVLAFDPIISLGKTHGKQAKGPFKVLSRHLSSYDLVHCVSGQRQVRNRRFLRRFSVPSDIHKALVEHQFLITESNEIRIPEVKHPDELMINFDLTMDHVPPVAPAHPSPGPSRTPKSAPSDSLDKSGAKYNLRPRAAKNYKS